MGPRWHLLEEGRYPVHDPPSSDSLTTSKKKDAIVADFRDLVSTVRVRDGEFLVGSSADRDRMGFGVSGEGGMLDERRVKEWEEVVERLLLRGNDEEWIAFDMGLDVQSRLSSRL